MREILTYGCARGAARKGGSYRDKERDGGLPTCVGVGSGAKGGVGPQGPTRQFGVGEALARNRRKGRVRRQVRPTMAQVPVKKQLTSQEVGLLPFSRWEIRLEAGFGVAPGGGDWPAGPDCR